MRERKYIFLLLSILSLIIFLTGRNSFISVDPTKQTIAFQQLVNQEANQLSIALQKHYTHPTQELPSYSKEVPYHIYLFRADTLINWNSTSLPITKFADLHFPDKGIIHLQNGWYLTDYRKRGEETFIFAQLIQHDFVHENELLHNTFSDTYASFSGSLSFDSESANTIIDPFNQGKRIGFIPELKELSPWKSVVLEFSLLSFLFFAFRYIFQLKSDRFSVKQRALNQIILVLCCFVSYQLPWQELLPGSKSLQPTLFGYNELLPNYFQFLLFILFCWLTNLNWQQLPLKKRNIRILSHFLVFFEWVFGVYLIAILIENSSIELDPNYLFSFSFYSVATLLVIGITANTIYRQYQKIFLSYEANQERRQFLLDTLWTNALGILLVLFLFQETIAFSFCTVLLALLLYLLHVKFQHATKFISGLLILAFFTFFTVFTLEHFTYLKSISDSEVLAERISSERDALIEYEFSKISNPLATDKLLISVASNSNKITFTELQNTLEMKFFSGKWDRYAVESIVFDKKGNSIIPGEQLQTKRNLDRLIRRNGIRSELDSSLYFISNYENQLSYISKISLLSNDSIIGSVYCLFRSKKIPEEIGFPRLLLTDKSGNLNLVEKYAIANYIHGKLTVNYGKFEYPRSGNRIQKLFVSTNQSNVFRTKKFYHVVHGKIPTEFTVLSIPSTSLVQVFSHFSLLFCFFGLFLLPSGIVRLLASKRTARFPLGTKIQIMFVSVVFLSLVIFSIGTFWNTKQQYHAFNTQQIKEKLHSIESELNEELENDTLLNIEKDGKFLDNLFRKYAEIYRTDINLYDEEGFLLASSQPRIFNLGLLGTNMNRRAFTTIRDGITDEYLTAETIGNLSYYSAYLPLYSREARQLGFLNLQYFGQQKVVEDQAKSFLIAMVNIFLILLLLTMVIAFIVSNWLTQPLRKLRANLSLLSLEEGAQPIAYNREDEIGELVLAYNKKIEELHLAAEKLAKNERESAWREMAKQVAHEIKNPLTPMKLSVQHLQRSFDPADPNMHQKIDRVAQSLIEQIDAMTFIANEFSNFAKMPEIKLEDIELVQLMRGVCEVFQNNNTLVFNSSMHRLFMRGDKDQLLRVFNNLLKNAYQAIPDKRTPSIHVNLEQVGEKIRITVKDNGIGMTDAVQKRLFIPYFTTKSGGTGLGLAMVKNCIDHHNGTISVQSEPNIGTTFLIELPLH